MKNLLLTLTIVMHFCFSIFAQSYHYQIKDEKFPINKNNQFFEDALNKVDVYMDDSLYTYGWQSDSNNWKLYYRNYFIYNSNGQLIENNTYSFSQDAWYYTDRRVLTYDVNHNLIEDLIYIWDNNSSSLVNSVKTVYTYNSNMQKTESIVYIWDGVSSSWTNSSKMTYTYNSNNKIMQTIHYGWNPVGSSWTEYNKTDYYYLENNLINYYTQQLWRSSSQNWVDYRAHYYYYDGYNNNVEVITHKWDTIQNNWFYYYDNQNFFDGNKKISDMNFLWNLTSSAWDTTNRSTLSYDINNALVEHIFETYSDYFHNFYNESRYQHFPSLHYSDINKLENQTSITLKTNPVKDFLHIEKINPDAEIEIYDLNGRLLLPDKINSGLYNVRELKPGMYLIKINQQNQFLNTKFIKL